MDLALQAGAATADAVALAAYLNAKLFISKDLNALSRMKEGERNWAEAGMLAPYSTCRRN
jgi:hypothetical protein